MEGHTGSGIGAVTGAEPKQLPVPDGEGPIVGRATELAHLLRTLDTASPDRSLLLLGDMGTGKSALLDVVVGRAEASGARVLRAVGSESESSLAFAALHQLLRPVRAETEGLPERQRAALHSAFGTGPAAAEEADLMLIGVAVLGLLSAVADRRAVVVVLDDAQWFDRSSLDALSFVARRLADDPVTMLIAARAGDHLPGFDQQVPTLTLGPLDEPAASRLLDLQPRRPTARMRTRILEEADGNPLALTELTRAVTAHEAATGSPGSPSTGPLPLTDRLERIFATRLNRLPVSTTRPLLLLAAMDTVDSTLSAPAVLPSPQDGVWAPAEEAGLVVRRTGQGLRFSHPLVRSAVYHSAPVAARCEAHLALAELLRDEPDRRAWHRAAAAVRPDGDVAAELDRTAGRARRRGGHAAAAKALQRAAELAPLREDSARLLVEAAAEAVLTGDLSWAEELAAAVRARTEDASLLTEVAAQVGRLAALTVRHSVVFSRLADAAEELGSAQPATALDFLAGAAVVRFYSGDEIQRRRIEAVLEHLPEGASQPWPRAWVRAVSDPFGHRAELLTLLPRAASEARRHPGRLMAYAITAWLLDETPGAVRAFDEAFDRWGMRGPLPDGLSGAAAWSYVEQGRWGRAREACIRSGALGSRAGLDHVVACAAAVDATVLAYQGDVSSARARAEEALSLIDPLESRSVSVYARRALGAAALAEGAHEVAYRQLRAVFTPDGAPVHYHASYPALADLAAAAVRGGHRDEAATIVERSAHSLGGNASPRLRALIERARGLLADPEDAEPHFRAALADPALDHWPFERAQARLDLAEWLRRRRRVAEARAPLTEALEAFRRLGARPWIERARTEARAAGLDITDSIPDALAELSPQQQQIIRFAARGLTNREIGERLFLSPRTVGSHLYRSFPKLGITARAQLRDLVEGSCEGEAPVARGG
ncbi:AAA family ATPase [Streptomyces sp. NBC_01012]|uniref:helix-turn-helix transcriptional regulator n=1 Tax=Streptomyces sp. NBC_01012 TaxID=2903717 RepID=UPI003863C688|nr:AAA family ATPase [Streptomyces sp. NBC_01012]